MFRCRTPRLSSKVTFLKDEMIPPEGYRAEVSSNTVIVWSSDAAGAFYAVRTLEQWAKKTYVPDPLKAAVKERAFDFELEAVEIEDAPVFRWRGFMIDEARHFLGKEAVLRQLELMSDYKLNVFHWHLADDQGWRLDLPGHPELVKYGAVRPRSVAYGAKAEWLGEEQTLHYELDNTRYGPFFYTPDEIREILAFAKARQITVVPEIELPGHERALLAARPDLSCRGAALERIPRIYWSVEQDVLCAGNDEALRYLEGVFDEVCKLFPDAPYIHIGGDECPKVRWKECPKCQKRMKELGAKDERELQAWFTRHFAEYLAKKGRRVVGWDEVLYGDVPKEVVGMSWRMSAKNGAGGDFVSAAEAAACGHDVVLTPSGYCYLSLDAGLEGDPYPYYGPAPYAEQAQEKKKYDPLTLAKAYSFDPYSFVAEKDRPHILGVQASVWSESIFTRFDFEWKAWPRTCALAEIAWSGPNARPFDDFRNRMTEQCRRLIARKVNCAPLGESVRMSATGDYRLPEKAQVVAEAPGYNSWPMVQAMGEKLVCAYSRDGALPKNGHSIGSGSRDSYLKVSADGGRTWSDEVALAADPEVGEVNEGIGLDSTGAALLWVRCLGKNRRHELYRTADGVTVEKLASISPDPFPMQVTDPVRVEGLGLVSPWFAGSYRSGDSNSWGLLVSTDDGRTWERRVIESGLSVKEWVTEPSLVDLGGGHLLIIGRCEQNLGNQFQVTSVDGGKTWRKSRTNIGDVQESTPSLVYDRKTGLLANYYYHRGARQLKRRVAAADFIFGRPDAWPEPEVLDRGFEERFYDAGNVNVTRLGGRDCCAWYTGTTSNATVVITAVPVP